MNTPARKNMVAERYRMGLTAGEVAERIHVHPNAVLRWERGTAEPRGSNLVNLSELYGCSPDYLLDLTNDPNGRVVAAV